VFQATRVVNGNAARIAEWPAASSELAQTFVAAQHRGVAGPIAVLLREVRPARVIEIGTADGGFTVLLRHLLDEMGCPDVPLHTFDVNPCDQLARVARGARIDVAWGDVFGSAPFSVAFMEALDAPGPLLLFCDGGNKVKEFNKAAPYLRPGDFIAAHDYAPSREEWSKAAERPWGWCEIEDADIADVCAREHLVPVLTNELSSVAWVCKRKGAEG
jgi:hypothetical protein